MKKIFAALLVALAAGACIPVLQSRYLTSDDISVVPKDDDLWRGHRWQNDPCQKWASYLPDTNHLEHTPMRYLRVNVHWMNTPDTAYDLTGQRAIDFAKGLIRAANYDLEKNRKMWLPNGNDTPVFPTNYRYLLTPDPNIPGDEGIYFHFDSELTYYVHKGKNRNLYRREVFDKYGVQMDSVLNIFIMAHHPDSVASPTYKAYGVGVALGNAIKLAGIYHNAKDRGDYWDYRGGVNHEVGHIFGLSHGWVSDGCDDTPVHKQDCFAKGQAPECDTLASNNFMDYTAVQNSWTPCQIGKVLQRMAQENHRGRKFLLPTWCELKDSLEIVIRDSVEWNSARDLEGHLTIAPGGQLVIRCRVSMPPGAAITVEPGGTLVLDGARLHNACDREWQGIIVQKFGTEAGKVYYTVEPTVENARNGLPLLSPQP
ncbi:MAG: hypothetical protein H6557_20900 [Lewinellaceae bacterium]|nr:hypothetical protein [Phaeodactylibacter sp.]MCB9039078.1 hypothetical protein [Lewinellaceae bacterium]